uniref:PUA domain-containing protein n=1 Tax=Micromonas pusilla TaxID=38833 RepID=A0A7S0NKQ8_MICPS
MASPASTVGRIAATARTLRRVCSRAPKSHALLNPHADALTRSLGALASIRGERVRRLSASAPTHASPSTTTRAGKANEWRGPRYGKGGRGGGRGGGGGGRGGGRGGASDAAVYVKRPRRAFTEDEQRRIAALQALADAGAAPVATLAKGKANLFLDGNPIVYGGAVNTIANGKSDAPPRTGDPIIVADHEGKALAWGVYNDTSQYVVRILRMAWECELAPHPASAGKTVAVKCDVEEVIRDKIKVAARMRSDCGVAAGNANGPTTVYRLVNSEGDGLSGVCVDVYDCGGEGGGGKVAVAAVSAAWAHMRRDAVVKALGECAGIDRVLWRTDARMLELEGIFDASRSKDSRSEETDDGQSDAAGCYDAETGAETSPPAGWVTVAENGVRYEVDLTKGHKTGFYVDQRDNRAEVRALGAGKGRVLDVCCYTGGFAINAALGGAADVTGVDSSPLALDIARRNAEVNGVAARTAFVQSEAFKYLDDLVVDAGNLGTFDMIVLDPPKLAPSVNALDKATRKYVKMNQAAMLLLRPGGILVTCSCSGAVTQRGLLPAIVTAAATAAGRRVTMLGKPRGAGADQPLDPAYPEGSYLTVVVCRVA